MKIAVIGGGISGLTCCHYLGSQHEVTLFEKNQYLGGHTHTHQFEQDSQVHQVDSGFIVFNQKTYPNFCKLLDDLKVPYKPSEMSFSFNCQESGLEYNGTTINTLFAQRKNLFSPRFYALITGILKFNRKAKQWLKSPDKNQSLGDFLVQSGISNVTQSDYILPIGAAVWSTSPRRMVRMPALFFLHFFENHGFLNIEDRPQWQVVSGGSHSYVEALKKNFKGQIHASCPVKAIRRVENHCTVITEQTEEQFDKVIFACHSDQALALLEQPTPIEEKILKAIPYEPNTAVIHWDEDVMPNKPLAWASWNYLRHEKGSQDLCVTYHMNRLQGFESEKPYFVTLNPSKKINQNKVLKEIIYQHPQFMEESLHAQERWGEINGKNNSYFCGAYWRYGFHEDGVWSALRVCKEMASHADRSHAKKLDSGDSIGI